MRSTRDKSETQARKKKKNKKLTWGDWREIEKRSQEFVMTAQDKRVEKMLGRIRDMTLEDVQKEMNREGHGGSQAGAEVSERSLEEPENPSARK